MDVSKKLIDVRERRLALLMQREAFVEQRRSLKLTLRAIDREVFACDGALGVLHELQAEPKESA